MLAKIWLWALQVAFKQFMFSIEQGGNLLQQTETRGCCLHRVVLMLAKPLQKPCPTMQLPKSAENSQNKGIKRKPSAAHLGQKQTRAELLKREESKMILSRYWLGVSTSRPGPSCLVLSL